MPQTIQEYARSHDKADPATLMAMMGSIAEAGRAWDKLPQNERTAEKAKEIARASLEKKDNAGGKPMDTTDLLFAKAGTREVVQKYNETLIERSEALDAKEGKAKGTHLQGFLDGVGAAVRHIDFDKFKQGDLTNVDLPAVRKDIAKASRDHIGLTPDKTVDVDMMETIKTDLANGGKKFGGIKVEPEEVNNMRVMGLMLKYGAALMVPPAEKTQEAGKAAPEKPIDEPQESKKTSRATPQQQPGAAEPEGDFFSQLVAAFVTALATLFAGFKGNAQNEKSTKPESQNPALPARKVEDKDKLAAFDLNKDGRVDKKDFDIVEKRAQSNRQKENAMKEALTGMLKSHDRMTSAKSFDINGDGRSNLQDIEMLIGHPLDRDGKNGISRDEITQAIGDINKVAEQNKQEIIAFKKAMTDFSKSAPATVASAPQAPQPKGANR